MATSPATVVPPGEHTASTRSAGVRPAPPSARAAASTCTARADPRTVWATISTARALGIPPSTPARARASMKVKTKAGAEPARPTKTGKSSSAMRTVRPTESMRARAAARSDSSAAAPAARAVMDWPTPAAMFGMARTTRAPSGRSDSRRARPIPAAMDTTRGRDAARASEIRTVTAGTTRGLTARTTTSAAAASAPASGS